MKERMPEEFRAKNEYMISEHFFSKHEFNFPSWNFASSISNLIFKLHSRLFWTEQKSEKNSFILLQALTIMSFFIIIEVELNFTSFL